MTSLSQAKDLYRMQREAKKVKKELKKIQIEAEGPGVRVVVSAEQEIVEIHIEPGTDVSLLPATLKDVFNRAMKKAQVVAAEKMQSVMGSMGMPTEEGMRGLSK